MFINLVVLPALFLIVVVAVLLFFARKPNATPNEYSVVKDGVRIFYCDGKEVHRCGAVDRKADWRDERHKARMEQAHTVDQLAKWLPCGPITNAKEWRAALDRMDHFSELFDEFIKVDYKPNLPTPAEIANEMVKANFGELEARINAWELDRFFPPATPFADTESGRRLARFSKPDMGGLRAATPSNVVEFPKARK